MAVLDTLGGLFSGFLTDPETGLPYEKVSTDPAIRESQKKRKREQDQAQADRDHAIATGGGDLRGAAALDLADPSQRAAFEAQGGNVETANYLAKQDTSQSNPLSNTMRSIGAAVAPKGVLEAASGPEQSEIAMQSVPQTAPRNQGAYQPAQSEVMQKRQEQEDPQAQVVKQNTEFAQKVTQEAQQKTGALDGKEGEATRSDFGASFASKLATIATFGAMIATGAGIPFALAAAASAWGGTEGMRQREADAIDLGKKGYSNAQINKYVHQGVLDDTSYTDQKALTDAALEKSNAAAEAARVKAAGGGTVKGLTESQAKARFGADRSTAANNMWNQRYGHIADEVSDYPIATLPAMYLDNVTDWKPGVGSAAIQAVMPNIMKARDNEMSYLAGVLRPESGSAIGLAEWKNYGHIYFPRRGDTKESLRQKAWLRDMTVQSLDNVAKSGNMSDKSGEKVVQDMAGLAGRVTDYNPQRKAVKLDDGNWYNVDDLVGANAK